MTTNRINLFLAKRFLETLLNSKIKSWHYIVLLFYYFYDDLTLYNNFYKVAIVLETTKCDIFSRYITMDEMWFHHFPPETEEQLKHRIDF